MGFLTGGKMMERDLKMYILVNEDIKISKGKLAGQVGHAVSTYFYHMGEIEKFILLDEYMKEQKKIILKCSQQDLIHLESEGCVAIRDSGLTELPKGTLTCVNLGILDADDSHPYNDFVKGLKLYH